MKTYNLGNAKFIETDNAYFKWSHHSKEKGLESVVATEEELIEMGAELIPEDRLDILRKSIEADQKSLGEALFLVRASKDKISDIMTLTQDAIQELKMSIEKIEK